MFRKTTLAIVSVLVVMSFAGSSVWAADGLEFDIVGLTFEYSVSNINASPGEVIGHITILDDPTSRLTLQHYDLGADGAFGGEAAAADVLLDVAMIGSSLRFDTLFEADVVKVGANDYGITSSTFAATDTASTLGSPMLSGGFISDQIQASPGLFLFSGLLSKSNNLPTE